MPKIMMKANTNNIENALASLPGRVFLVLSTVTVLVGVLSLVFSFYLIESNFLNSLIFFTSLGLISGLTSRLFLRRFTLVLRILTALVSLSLGMIIRGGVSPAVARVQPLNRGDLFSDGAVILQFIFCATIAILSNLAWHKSIVRIKRSPENPVPNNLRNTRTLSKRPTNTPRQITQFVKKLSSIHKDINIPRLRVMNKIIIQRIKNLQRKLISWISNGLIRSPRRIRLNPSFPMVKSSRRRFHLLEQTETIKLVGEEIHNCPYCLEPVSKNDSRGRKICSICKTWHHADCWAEAGECQVPHHHK